MKQPHPAQVARDITNRMHPLTPAMVIALAQAELHDGRLCRLQDGRWVARPDIPTCLQPTFGWGTIKALIERRELIVFKGNLTSTQVTIVRLPLPKQDWMR